MADRIVETRETGTGTGMVLGIVVVLLVAVVVAFFVFAGGANRFAGGNSTPNQTNVNVPQQQQPAQQPSAPNVNVPGQIDVNVNPGQQAPNSGR
jgi:hypothetical protein